MNFFINDPITIHKRIIRFTRSREVTKTLYFNIFFIIIVFSTNTHPLPIHLYLLNMYILLKRPSLDDGTDKYQRKEKINNPYTGYPQNKEIASINPLIFLLQNQRLYLSWIHCLLDQYEHEQFPPKYILYLLEE